MRQSDGLWGDTPEDCEMRQMGAKASLEMARLLGVSGNNALSQNGWIEEKNALLNETEELRKQVRSLKASLTRYEYLVEKKEYSLTPEQAERICQIATDHNTTLSEIRFGSQTNMVCEGMREICKYLGKEGKGHKEIGYFLKRERSTVSCAIRRANGNPPRPAHKKGSTGT